MRSPDGSDLTDTVHRREAYQLRRSRDRRVYGRVIVALTIAWLGSCVAGTAASASLIGEICLWIAFVALMTLFLTVAFYVARRRESRVDSLEPGFDPASDPFPQDRLVPPDGRALYVVGAVVLGTLAASAPWAFLSDSWTWSTGIAVAYAAWVGLVALVVTVAMRRLYRPAAVETETGVRLTSFIRTQDVPWSDVRGIGLQELVVSNRYASSVQPQLVIVTPSDRWATVATALGTASDGERARTRHNIRVVHRWAQEHDLPTSDGFAAAVRYADGLVDPADLLAACEPRGSWQPGGQLTS